MFEFYSKEQEEIRQSVRKLAEQEIPNYALPQAQSEHGELPRKLFDRFAEFGLCGMSIPEDFGGSDTDPVAATLIYQEIAAVNLGPAIFLSVHNMVSGLIAKFGSDAIKERYLPLLASGKFLAAFALTESHAGSDASALRSKAVQQADGSFLLSGSKCWITSAGFADLYLVFAKTSPEKGKDGMSAFLLEATAPGLRCGEAEKKMGCELSPIATMEFDQVHLAPEALLGTLDEGYAVALSGLAGGRINIAACANGISQSALQRALAHLEEREQFGQKLIEFQGLQFMIADMKIKLDAAELLTWRAAKQLGKDAGARENRLYPSIAKCFATDAAMSISTDAVQLLGGAGYVREYEVERLMREAKMLQIVEGANQIQRSVICRELRKR